MERHVDVPGAEFLMERTPLTPVEIAAFLDGQLEGPDLSRVQALLAADPDARQELIKASRIVTTAPASGPPRRSWIPAFGTLAAAAAIAILVIPVREAGRDAAPTSADRRAPADARPKIQLVVPAAGSPIREDESEFMWRRVDGATYRVVVTDLSGNTLIHQNTPDTALAIPEALLNDGAIYYFSVDALLPDGSSVGSGADEFVMSLK